MKHEDMGLDKGGSRRELSSNQEKVNPKNKRVCLANDTQGQKPKRRRNTIQYKLVLDTMLAMKDAHPSAPEIHKEIAKIYPGISNATVYGQMRRLEEDGIIRVISCLGSADRFDAILDEHYHIKCEACGTVCDLVIDLPMELDEKAAKISGYSVKGHNIVFSGICSDCQKNGIRIKESKRKKDSSAYS